MVRYIKSDRELGRLGYRPDASLTIKSRIRKDALVHPQASGADAKDKPQKSGEQSNA
jgi:hypothetical protein